MAATARAQSNYGIEDPLHNPHLGLDVDNNGIVSPRDLLLVIEALSHPALSSAVVPLTAVAEPLGSTPTATFFYDTNDDKIFSPGDALVLVDYFRPNATAPEPSSLLTAGIGMSLLAGYAWRHRRKNT
jgi:hypothetical protein